MERKQMLEELESKKKEYARKLRKLEKAKRAARAKAHVKQKLQELNVQAIKEKTSDLTPSASSSVNTSALNDHPHACSSADEQLLTKDSVQITHDNTVLMSDSSKASALNQSHSTEKGQRDLNNVKNSFSGEDKTVADTSTTTRKDWLFYRNGTSTCSCSKGSCTKCNSKKHVPVLASTKKIESSHVMSQDAADMNCNNTHSEQCETVMLDVEDSLAVTPTFRSLRDTNVSFTNSTLQNQLPTLDTSTGIDLYTNTLTLDFKSEESFCDKEISQSMTMDNVNQIYESGTGFSKKPLISTSHRVTSQNEEMHQTTSGTCQEFLIDDSALNKESEDCLDNPAGNDHLSDNRRTQSKQDKLTLPAQHNASCVSVPNTDMERQVLSQQDISNYSEDGAFQHSTRPSSLCSQTSDSPQDQFLDYTELDVIPFSQFQLTEDFLSESSQLGVGDSQIRRKRQSASALVQRRSPRLSSLDLGSCESTGSSKHPSYRSESQQSRLLRMARKQRKTKKALLVTSLFEYLIDNAKRKAAFVEFKLPDDIANSVSCVRKGTVVEEQLDSDETSSATKTELWTADMMDVDVIPETEIDPDFMSQRNFDQELEVKSEDSQLVEKGCEPQNRNCTELELEFHKNRNERFRAFERGNRPPSVAHNLSVSPTVNPEILNGPASAARIRSVEQDEGDEQSATARQSKMQRRSTTSVCAEDAATTLSLRLTDTERGCNPGFQVDNRFASDDCSKNVATDHSQDAGFDSSNKSSTKSLSSNDSQNKDMTQLSSFNCHNKFEPLTLNTEDKSNFKELEKKKKTSYRKETQNIQYSAILATGSQESSASGLEGDKDGALLKLQDISNSEEGLISQKNVQSSSLSETSDSPQDQFPEYTELDVIPFSQFQLTEDFLSESSRLTADDSQSKRKKKGTLSLVQRKSPRLSFESGNCGNVVSDNPYWCETEQRKLPTMARRQMKSKKALLLSSLFEYLIDEAKRNTSFVEFRLPEDITSSLCRGKGQDFVTEKHLQCEETSSSASVELCVPNLLEMDIIPETERDPDFSSQQVHDDKLTVNSEYSQRVYRHYQPEVNNCVSNESLTQKDRQDQERSWSHPAGKNGSCSDAEHLSSGLPSDNLKSILCGLDSGGEDAQLVTPGKYLLHLQPNSARSVINTKEIPKSLKGSQLHDTDTADSSINVSHTCVVSEDTDTGSHEIRKLDHSPDKVRNVHSSADHTEPENHCSKTPSLASDVFPSNVTVGSSSSPANHQSQCSKARNVSVDDSQAEAEIKTQICQKSGDQTDEEETWNAAFTPCKSENTDGQVEPGGCTWVRFAGCAESGCKDAVIDTIVGSVSTNKEETTFILSVQTSVLTLWTQDDTQEWCAEFHWYLPQASKAEGACRIYTADGQLAVLVWGLDIVSLAPFLTVYVYQWDTQHTQRFGLVLPPPTTTQSIFCHGLQCASNSVLVFTSDETSTKGRKFRVDTCHNCLTMELAMEVVRAGVVGVRLVDGLPDAVLGLTMDQTVLIWNHKTGELVTSVQLPSTVPHCSKIFTCYSLQGYLLFHVAEAAAKGDLCVVALNPFGETAKVLRRFKRPTDNDSCLRRAFVHQDVLVSVSTDGMLHQWDACSAKLLLSIKNKSDKILTANIIRNKCSCLLLTGHDNGCLHLYSICH